MVTAITRNIPLIAIYLRDGNIAFKEATKEEYNAHKPKKTDDSFREIDTSEGLIRYSNISRVREATGEEYFFYFLEKGELKIETWLVSKLKESLSNLGENQRKKLKLTQILGYIDRKREEEGYYKIKKT